MQNDELIWAVVGKTFCSYKANSDTIQFCRNEYNVTGLCNRSSCPLANSNYATVMEHQGECYLYLKTVERSHTPKKLWERIALGSNLEQSLAIIDRHMVNAYTAKQIERCKLRLLRMRETLKRMRMLEALRRPKLLTVRKKTERREATREKKAEVAAKIDDCIEEELLNRLRKGTYGDIYNYTPEVATKETDPEKSDVDSEKTAATVKRKRGREAITLEEEEDGVMEQETSRVLRRATEAGDVHFIEDPSIEELDDIEGEEAEGLEDLYRRIAETADTGSDDDWLTDDDEDEDESQEASAEREEEQQLEDSRRAVKTAIRQQCDKTTSVRNGGRRIEIEYEMEPVSHYR